MTEFVRTLVAAAVLVAAGTAHAQDGQKVGAWNIYQNDTNCSALTTFGDKDKAVLWIAYNKAQDTGSVIMLENDVFASTQDSRPYDGQLVFVRREELDDSLSDRPVAGAVLEGERKGVLVRAGGNALMNALSGSRIVGLLRPSDREVIISLKVDDTAEVVRALRACTPRNG